MYVPGLGRKDGEGDRGKYDEGKREGKFGARKGWRKKLGLCPEFDRKIVIKE